MLTVENLKVSYGNIKALLESGAPAITIFGKSWDLHVTDIMNNTREENLAMIKESVAYLLSHDREIIYDAEHFFDGYLEHPEYSIKVLKTAVNSGADVLCLCDTNGGIITQQMIKILHIIRR